MKEREIERGEKEQQSIANRIKCAIIIKQLYVENGQKRPEELPLQLMNVPTRQDSPLLLHKL